MKGDWWEVYYQKRRGEHCKYLGFVRFEVDHPPFQEKVIEREQVRFYLRRRLPWEYDTLPGFGADGKCFGPIEYAEWYARQWGGLAGHAQAYRRTGGEVWVVEVTDGKTLVTVEVFVEENARQESRGGKACYNAILI